MNRPDFSGRFTALIWKAGRQRCTWRPNSISPARVSSCPSPSPSNELLYLLGSDYEKNNRQALDAWVAYHHYEFFEQRLEGQSPLGCLICKIEQFIRC